MKRRFRPSESWSLEERIALSHAAEISALAVPRTGLHAVVHGVATVTTRQGVDTHSQVASLSGSTRAAGVGHLNLSGTVTSSQVNVRSFPDTGKLVIISRSHIGTLNLTLTGPHSNLGSKTSHLSFTVTRATGQLAPLLGAKGVADLTLNVSGGSATNASRMGTAHGKFTLVLKQA